MRLNLQASRLAARRSAKQSQLAAKVTEVAWPETEGAALSTAFRKALIITIPGHEMTQDALAHICNLQAKELASLQQMVRALTSSGKRQSTGPLQPTFCYHPPPVTQRGRVQGALGVFADDGRADNDDESSRVTADTGMLDVNVMLQPPLLTHSI